MYKLFVKQVILLFCLSVMSGSFRQGDETKDKGSFSATVDGSHFECESKLFRGILVSKEASMDGRTPARTVISVSFKGPSYNIDGGKFFSESVEFEINYKEQKTGNASDYLAVLQYKSTNYFMVKEQSKLNITKMEWEGDKKHFWLSADFRLQDAEYGLPERWKEGCKPEGAPGGYTHYRTKLDSC